MEETRRSGVDRRRESGNIESDRRDGGERRSAVSDTDRMIGFLKTIPVFTGLTYEQYRKLLYICYNKTLPADCFVYEEGDRSEAMFILLKGQLKLLYHKSTLVTHVDPVSLVGEIGFFTNRPRQVSAVTTGESSIIKLNRTELHRVFQGDGSLSNRVLTNIISQLAAKLEKYTDIIHELRSFRDGHGI